MINSMEPDVPQSRESSPTATPGDATSNVALEVQQLPRPTVVRESKGLWGGIIAVAAVLFTKIKLILGFFFTVIKSSKLLTTGLSMLVSVWAYALAYPLSFAIGLVLLILVHEMGHVFVLMKYGLKATAPVFIPFFGAMVGLKELPKNVEMEAWVGYGGPLLGSIGALVCLGIYFATNEIIYLILAHTGFMLNLFNLIPIHPMDGGRITGALSRWFWVVGWIVGVAWFILGGHNPLMFIILLMGAFKIFSAFFKKEGERDPSYYQISATSRAWIALAYFSLVIVLSFMSLHTDELIPNRNF